MPRHILPILLIALILAAGCSRRPADSRLLHAAAIVDSLPDSAASIVSAIGPATLSGADRPFRDLLAVKTADKAYVTHTSDSLILSVIAYAEAHPSCGFLPEAHYYAGRVLSDLGDYPTALRHFQAALDLLPPSSPSTILRGNVLSQTGRLLNTLRLYDQAVPYLEEVIRLEQAEADTVNEVYDLQLLGAVHMHAHEYAKADSCFHQALVKSANLPPYHAAKSRMYLAAVKYFKDDIDSALILIRDVPDAVKKNVRASALSYAAVIYQEAEVPDTALFYATELIGNSDYSNRRIGFQVLLSPLLRHKISIDSVCRYVQDYHTMVDQYFSENDNFLAINQQAFYNYQLHERDKDRAEHSARVLRRSVALCLLLLLLLALTLCYLRIRAQSRVIRLQQALHSVSELRRQLVASEARHESFVSSLAAPDSSSSAPKPAFTPSERELRLRLRDELTALSARSDARPAVPDAISGSDAYASLLRHIADCRIIPDADPLWQQICEAVTAASPQFLARLRLLTLATLTPLDLHTALLIKCGIRPSQMMILLGRSNGAVISRRETLGYKIFDEKTAVRSVDAIIRLL